VGAEVRADQTTPLVTISNLATVWALVDVYEQDLPRIQKGAPVRLTVSAYPGEVFSGVVSYIGDVVDPISRTLKVRCEVPNPGAKLRAEMFASVELGGPVTRKVLAVPRAAVLANNDYDTVLVAHDGRF